MPSGPEPPIREEPRSPSPEPRPGEDDEDEEPYYEPNQPEGDLNPDEDDDDPSLPPFDLDTPASGRRSGRRDSVLTKTPATRSHQALIREGLRQSMGTVRVKVRISDDIEEKEVEQEEKKSHTLEVDNSEGVPVIDGRPLSISARPKAEVDFAPIRLWDKQKRELLSAEGLLAFRKSATGYVLPKNKKLSAPQVVVADDDNALVHVLNLQSQIKIVKAHLISHDMCDVMHIVVPEGPL